jgi:guanylate kinase
LNSAKTSDTVPRSKIAVGDSRLSHYIQTARLRHNRQVIWENSRYQATYVIDAPELHQRLAAHHPVLHLGQPEAIGHVIDSTPDTRWLVVHLWCPRDIAHQRLIERGSADISERLQAWDETPPLPQAELVINTAEVPADQAAALILTRTGPF